MAAFALAFTLLMSICCQYLKLASTITNITTTKFLNDSQTIVSSNAQFKLGFFSPINSTYRYVGIWYNITDSDTKELVWVANRNNPVNDSSGVLIISDDGNLQLLDGQEMILWSSNLTHQDNTTLVAQLRDTGNLVLLSAADSEKIVWQSFEHLTNALLPQTRISLNLSIDQGFIEYEYPILRSWKSASDPSNGDFRIGLIPFPITEFIVRRSDDKTYWRSGPWNGSVFIGIPFMQQNLFRIFYEESKNTLDLLYNSVEDEILLEYLVLNYDGNVVLKSWNDDRQNMETLWNSIQSECDLYGKCGPFGRCNSKDLPICNCLNGFEPKNIDEWSSGNWTSGCVRTTPLQCGNTGHKADGFWRLQHMKVPHYISFAFDANDQDDCKRKCLETCSCLACTYREGIGCMIWEENLMDIQVLSGDGVDLFIRLAHSELAETSNTKLIIIIAVVATVATTAFVVFTYCLWQWMYRRNVKKSTNTDTQFVDIGVDQAEFKDLSLFEFKELEAATIDFCEINKLGEGGFGSVYKGKLENGQEIAVKRLSRASGQGIQEFMNEVLVISKLQHKNLVKLLGCCAERDEKILVYEFMPNKSLDAFLFDSHDEKRLDWKNRFDIINGICRGLLYLHRDSRLKIIHRDLKASNILLDEDLNPKISDFGMARIFSTKQDQANTLRVVGTYGYMSPEYAMEGRFSEKSDVFSLGVLLLEIVSGRKNSSFLNHDSLSLLTHTWKLWNENDMIKLIDPTILDPCFESEIMKCIHLGLLCVQEYPEDRPTISALLSMLDVSDIIDLPHPTQPGFTHLRKASSTDEIVPSQEYVGSVNHVSLTAFSGR